MVSVNTLRGITLNFSKCGSSIQFLFYYSCDSKAADLISLKFTVKFDHCPRFTSSFHSIKFSLPLVFSSHLSPLTSAVVGAPQMTLQQYLSTIPCLPLHSGNLQTPFLPIPCYLPISYSVFLSFSLLSLSPVELFSPCQRIFLAFYKCSNFFLRRGKWSKWMKFRKG